MGAKKKPGPESHVCPLFHRAVEVVGRRWSGAILRVLLDGPKRFGEMRDAIPEISDRLLSERLKELEGFGLLRREPSGSRPVVDHYTLTPQGRALKPALDALGTWAAAWLKSSDV
jgi:DNA-binding HxlR family transcriptional regulator